MSENKEPNAIYWPAGGKLLARITKNGKMVAIFKVAPTDEIGHAMAAAIDEAKDVTQILLSVTPGPDGEGQENYAKSVDDVVALLGEQSDQIEALETQRLRADTAEAEVAKLIDKLSYEERDHHTTNLSRDAWRNKYEELLNLIKRAQSFVAFVHKCCRKNKEYAPLHWQEMVELDRDLSGTTALNPNPEAESHE
jgi:uncharacterized protein CbrC (UPF0167 family)